MTREPTAARNATPRVRTKRVATGPNGSRAPRKFAPVSREYEIVRSWFTVVEPKKTTIRIGTRRKIRNHTAETEASSSPFDAFVEPSRAMRRKNALVSVGVTMTHTDVRLNQRGLYSFTRTSAPTSRGRSHRFQSSGARRMGYRRGSARMSYPFAKGVRRSQQALFGVG